MYHLSLESSEKLGEYTRIYGFGVDYNVERLARALKKSCKAESYKIRDVSDGQEIWLKGSYMNRCSNLLAKWEI